MNPVIFWIPNLIGYLRIILAGLALYHSDSWQLGFSLYAASQLMDALDGTAARYFNQSSSFGAVLDMLTDRLSSMGLMVILSQSYTSYTWFWISMVMLDTASHWTQMYKQLSSGLTSHKQNTNAVLNFYYSSPWLFVFCFGNEAFLVLMYINSKFTGAPVMLNFLSDYVFGETLSLVELALVVSAPFFVAKQFFNLVQWADSAAHIAARDDPRESVKTRTVPRRRSNRVRTPAKPKAL